MPASATAQNGSQVQVEWEWNVHHIFGPKKDYKTKLERAFRNAFTVRIPIPVHGVINQIGVQQFPPKPSEEFMREALRQVRESRRCR